MSTGNDVVEVVKSAHEVYKAAKQGAKDVDSSKNATASDVKSLKAHHKKLRDLLDGLPNRMTRAEMARAFKAAKELAEARLAEQDPIDDLEEIQRLRSQIFVLELAEAKIALQNAFDVSALVSQKLLQSLVSDVEVVGEEIATQLRVKAFYRISIKAAIFTLNLAVLIAKAVA